MGAQHRLSDDAARALLARGQRLTEPERSDGASVADAVRAVVGLQAQDRRAGALGVRARLDGVTEADVEGALEQRSIVRVWSMRGTLHYVTAEDAGWLIELLGPVALARARKRFEGLGLDGDEPVRVVRELLADSEPLTRHEIAAAARERGLRFADDPQAPVHLVMRAVLAGEAIEVGWRGGKPVHASWAGRRRATDRDVLLAELARRYLSAHAPAGPRDLATWSGLPVPEARRAFELIAREVEPVEVLDRGDAYVPRGRTPPEGPAGVRLLPAWDNLLLCHRDRRLTVPPDVPPTAVANGGVLRPTVLVGGQVRGIWRLARGEPAIEPFEPLAPDVAAAVEADAADVVRFRANDRGSP